MKDCNFKGWFAEQISTCITCVSPHFNERPSPKEISLVVIHNISLPPEQFGGGHIEDFFKGSLDTNKHPYFREIQGLKVSSHFLIERKGGLTQFVKTVDRAWHAGTSQFLGRNECNDFSIGIELEGSDNQPFTQQQYQKLVELCQSLMTLYPSISAERIVGHSDISPKRKTDPGPFFDWQEFYQLLNSIN